MRIRRWREHVGLRGLSAFFALFLAAGSADWGHTAWDDPGCDPPLVLHDHAAHRFTSGAHQNSAPPEHCYLCHALRLLHAAVARRGASLTPAVAAAQHSRPDVVFARGVDLLTLSSRAPPPDLL